MQPTEQPESLLFDIGGQKFALTHGALVNNAEHSDVQIHLLVGGKKEVVHAHSFFLHHRGVKGLLELPSDLCSKIEKKHGHTVSVISDAALVFCSVQILTALMQYVYCGNVEPVEKSEDLPFLVNLLATATAAGMGDAYIARTIEDRVMALTNDSTAHLLVARTWEYHLERLHHKVRRFAFANWSRFISDKDGCRRLGMVSFAFSRIFP